MNERYLIINADDFGLCPAMNQAICELFRMGSITSSSVLAPAPEAVAACKYAVDGHFPVGVHWTLYSEWERSCWPPAYSSGKPSSLTADGCLPADGGAAAKRAASSICLFDRETIRSAPYAHCNLNPRPGCKSGDNRRTLSHATASTPCCAACPYTRLHSGSDNALSRAGSCIFIAAASNRSNTRSAGFSVIGNHGLLPATGIQ